MADVQRSLATLDSFLKPFSSTEAAFQLYLLDPQSVNNRDTRKGTISLTSYHFHEALLRQVPMHVQYGAQGAGLPRATSSIYLASA